MKVTNLCILLPQRFLDFLFGVYYQWLSYNQDTFIHLDFFFKIEAKTLLHDPLIRPIRVKYGNDGNLPQIEWY